MTNAIEDFENAPIGATATNNGVRAMKTGDGGWCWALSNGHYRDDEEMKRQGFTLDLPTTAREAKMTNAAEDFENAPVGATATHSNGARAMKTGYDGWCWAVSNSRHYNDDDEMERQGFTLDLPRPASADEALADAGPLTRTLPAREDIAEVAEAEILAFFDWPGLHPELPLAVADAVLALLKGQDA